MAKQCDNWKVAFEAIAQEPSLARQLKQCRKVRRLMQDRTLELAAAGGDPVEEAAIDEGLRRLWSLEEAIRKQIN
jgi:hypothetical protein